MKLSAKIFFCITIFFSIIFLLGGYTLITFFYESSMKREIDIAVQQYQYNKFVVQANLITRGEEWFESVAEGKYDIGSMTSDMNHSVAFFALDGKELFSDFPADTGFAGQLANASKDQVNYQFYKIKNRTYLIAAGIVSHDNVGVYLVTGTEVEKVLEQQKQVIEKFGFLYAVAIGTGILLILGLSALLTRPIKLLSIATKKIADGNYKERVADVGGDEVGQLARNFNQMALAIESKMQELSENAKQKEDFVANFAHELKTPLTSIIGYADRIYQKEMSREEQKKAAWYIWNEGMRLEALSLKLMDLTLLNHKEFILEEMKTDIMFRELAADVAYLMTQKGVLLDCDIEQAYIKVEYDLFKTLFLNLVDNSIKAGAKNIKITGRLKKIENTKPCSMGDTDKWYFMLQFQDNGSGIPPQDIKRITEAFYMVDKSRSRKQHGAGIGLALAEKIARIHGSRLEFACDGQRGTKVSICLECKEALNEE